MAKASPAFQFYPSDFLSSTTTLTDAEIGVYIRLLSWSWLNGPLPLDPQRIRRAALSSASETEWAAIWAAIKPRWTQQAEGYTNDRLERTRAEQDEYREKQRQNGLLGGRPKTQTEPKQNPPLSSGLTQTEPKNNPSAFDLRLCSSSLTSVDQDPAQSDARVVSHARKQCLASIHRELDANAKAQFTELAERAKQTAADNGVEFHPLDVTAMIDQVQKTRERRARA